MLRADGIPGVDPLGQHKPQEFENNRGGVVYIPAAERLASAPWSGRPDRVCAVIGVFLEAWREGLPENERSILAPLLAKTVDTQGSPRSSEKRALMAADWLVRTHAPVWLDLAGLREEACLLADLPEIADMTRAFAMRALLAHISQRANAEAAHVDEADWIKASDDCWATAWAAAFEAARLGADDVAWVSAAAASRAAAGLAARALTCSAKADLQASAARLVLRMTGPLG